MPYPIENEAAYQDAIRRKMIRNGCVGRAVRLDDEAPMIVRLIQEVITPEQEARHAKEEARRAAAAERAGGVSWPAGTDPDLVEWDADIIAFRFIPMFNLDDRADLGESINRIRWEDVECYTFPEQLVINHLKTAKGLSAKQQAWVEKLVAEQPEKERIAAERLEARQKADAASTHQGEVKERLRGLEVTVEFVKTLDGGDYGPKRIVKMRDAAGNLFVTFATSDWVWDAEKGQALVLDGTVKAHDSYQGAAQTILTRTKAIHLNDEIRS